MVRIALGLYDFFERRRPVFWTTFVVLVALLGFGASRITIEEDISKFFPDDKKNGDLNYVFQNAKFTDQLVVMVSQRDSSAVTTPDSLVARAELLLDQIQRSLATDIRKIRGRVEDEKVMEVLAILQDNLPVFLTEADYVHLDSVLVPDRIRETLEQNHDQLLSPAGLVLKKIIVQDPLGFTFLPLQKLKGIQYDENFELYDGFVMTRDHHHLLLFLTPARPPIETGHNTKFIADLNALLQKSSSPSILISSFGASAVAVGNALQLRQDTIITVSVLVISLGVFLIWFFRRKRIPLLIFLPVVFGALFSLSCISLVKGSVSILALAAGSMILGIAINYALHFLAHQKHTNNLREVIADLVGPMTVGNFTTVLAFFCLQFTNAAVLRDIGLFAGFSLIGAAICSLVFLPHFIPENLFAGQPDRGNFIERIPFERWTSKPYVIVVILLLTPVFFHFAGRVTFNSDVSKLNFMSEQTLEAQHRLEALNNASQSTIFIVSRRNDLEHALRANEHLTPLLDQLKSGGQVRRFSSVSSFLISDSLQRIRIARWKQFWSPERQVTVGKAVREEGKRLNFSARVLNNFDSLITKRFDPVDTAAQRTIRNAFFDDYIIEKDSTATVISLANADVAKKAAVYNALKKSSSQAFDRQRMANLFVEYVNADFNFIVMFTAILVFLSLLLSYGRIELTVITFVPMFITWIWILGIMALFKIQFNIVNVMVSTFIFGLGDDYSIFIMDGLQQEYTTGRKTLPSIRTSIFLSAVTTVTGLGVLFLASHPAMRSIAAISIIGIVCVFVMAQTIEPWLFRLLITNRTQKRLSPKTWAGMLGTCLSYGTFLSGSVVMTLLGFVLNLIPIGKKKIKYFYHWLLSPLARVVIYLEIFIRKKYIGFTAETLRKPCVLIANHSSVVDILLTMMLRPKVILITNKWVWNSPILGGVARLADYYSAADGVEGGFEKFQRMVADGYSIVIFPEGTRSPDGKIARFHKGAFFLAEKLNIPIQPMLIHGADFSSPKGTFYITPGKFTLKFLPLIKPDDTRFGSTYTERTKLISRYFKKEHELLSREVETPEFFRKKLISNYIYKGPVLEWYLRVKLMLEKNYSFFYEKLPREGALLDLGCGYGFLCHLLHLRNPDQPITGVDYDRLKIETASHSYLCTAPLQFEQGDVKTFPLETYAGIVVSDTLHYLPVHDQWSLVERCCAALAPGGVLIIQDGDVNPDKSHIRTKVSEFFSIHVLSFNKSENNLSFLHAEDIVRFASARGLHAVAESSSRLTSNVLIVIRKPDA